MDTSVTMPPYQCPVCGYLMDRAAAVGWVIPIHPTTGDLSICAWCLSVGVFQEDGTLRTATTEECEEVPEYIRARMALTLATDTRRPS